MLGDTDKAPNRFIPAGAGNTANRIEHRHGLSVYPRWRGEHSCPYRGRGLIVGLSPMARGPPGTGKYIAGNDRFIPAGAGNTSPNKKGRPEAAVYPRWRGEHISL